MERLRYTHGSDPTDLISLDDNVLEDARYTYLRRRKFVRGPTTRSAWMGLVNQAWSESHLPGMPRVKAYVVLMLERSMTQVDMTSYQIGLTFFQREIADAVTDKHTVQTLADLALLFTSLFPDRMLYRYHMLSRSAMVDIGSTLYHRLWVTDNDVVYNELANSFMEVVMVLQHLRPTAQNLALYQHDEATLIPSGRESAHMSKEVRDFHDMFLTSGSATRQ
jgi:hypothetical protein